MTVEAEITSHEPIPRPPIGKLGNGIRLRELKYWDIYGARYR